MRRTKTAHARTRGAAAMVYGDLTFCLVEVMAKLARRWSRRGVVEGEFPPGGLWIGSWLRLRHKSSAVMLAKSVYWGIRRNGGVAA